MTVLLLGLTAAVVAGLGIALLDLTIRRAEVGAAAVFLSALVQAVFFYNVPSVRLGGIGWGSPTWWRSLCQLLSRGRDLA